MNPKTSADLFNKIRSQFANIRIGDESGVPTGDPASALFFEFEFKEDADTYGAVSISLADGENMKVFYNRNLVDKIDEDSRDEWYAFLKELKDFAIEHQLRFDVRDITKSNLTKQDYKNMADTNATVNTDEMSEEVNRITTLAGVNELNQDPKPFKPVREGLTGTAKRSYENLDKTRLIIRHSGKVDETVPGARSRRIDSLYIENEDGERFKYPLTHLAGARAMMRHVANGGRPHDEFGQHIVKTSENIAQLNSFSRYVSHKDQLNDNAGDIIEQTKLKLENLRTYMVNLSKQGHYDEASKNFKPSAVAELSDDEKSAYREKFTLKNLDDRVEQALPLIHNIMQEYQPEEPSDKDAKIEPIVDHGAIVQSFLTNPDKKLILRKDDTADKMLSVTKFTNNNTMLGSILSDIASRMLTQDDNDERVANFASRVADGLEREGELFNDPDSDWPKNKKIAIQLARRYIEDYKKMKADPSYADEVRMDAGAFKPKGHLKKKEDASEFVEWADDVTNEYAQDNYQSWLAKQGRDVKNLSAEEHYKLSQQFKMDRIQKAKDLHSTKGPGDTIKYTPSTDSEPARFEDGTTFEDIKPYVSMYKGDDGKVVHDVLDKDGNSAYKTNDAKDAMNYLSKNFSKLRGPAPKVGDFIDSEKDHREISRIMKHESINEARTKIVTAIKAKADGDNAQNIAGVEEEISRITQLANYQ